MQNWSCKFTKFNDLSNSLAAWKDAWESAKFVWTFPGKVACEANLSFGVHYVHSLVRVSVATPDLLWWLGVVDHSSRLGGHLVEMKVLRATGSYPEQDWKAFFVGGINFSTIGCWEITARHDDDKLSYVVWVIN
jgi:hypothetical protein